MVGLCFGVRCRPLLSRGDVRRFLSILRVYLDYALAAVGRASPDSLGTNKTCSTESEVIMVYQVNRGL